jgi:hypothetical protein
VTRAEPSARLADDIRLGRGVHVGICKDDATSYLKHLGYNVVRHSHEGIDLLQLIGSQSRTASYLGCDG